MTNEEIYMRVCKAYFVDKTPKHQIADTMAKHLVKYKHSLRTKTIIFHNPIEAVDEIITTELESQYLAKHF